MNDEEAEMTTCRVFAATDSLPGSADLERDLADLGRSIFSGFLGDGAEWYHGELTIDAVVVEVDRWLAEEEGIRAELNNWAAAVELAGAGGAT